jgi:O-methyltransferase
VSKERYQFINDEYKLALRKCAHYIRHDRIQGDYLEFGVFNGFSLKHMYDLRIEFELDKISNLRLFGFDSFEGFPPNETTSFHFKEGQMSGDYDRLLKYFPPFELNTQVHLIKGYFNNTLTQGLKDEKNLTRAAIINIDCDLFDSTLEALTFSDPLIQPGTLLIFDDWFCYKGNPEYGEQGAFNLWMKQNSRSFKWVEFFRYGVHGKILLCVGIDENDKE